MPLENPEPGRRERSRQGSYTYLTDRLRNPFDIDHPSESVPGYGDPNADIHVIGEEPDNHGGSETGTPFTETPAGKAVQSLLHDAGLLDEPYTEQPEPDNVFFSYLNPCTDPDESYEPSFDAELRAVGADVLVPVGEEAINHVLNTYTSQRHRYDPDTVHGEEIHGLGFMVFPLQDPHEWAFHSRDETLADLEAMLEQDYQPRKLPEKYADGTVHF